jgi:circadian clock protein KaiB
MIKLRLYVTGSTPTSQRSIDSLHELLRDRYADQYELEVFDVFEHPEAAFEDAVFVTPTLTRILPPPVIRLIGDLSNRERVLAGLAYELGKE